MAKKTLNIEDLSEGINLLVRLGGDKRLLRQLIQMFLEDCPRILAQIRKAVDRQDFERLAKGAHALKGSLANFGCRNALLPALRLEAMARAHELTGLRGAAKDLELKTTRLRRALVYFLKADDRACTTSLNVLVAEDNLVNQRLIARLLEKRGHRAVLVGNGVEALAALEKDGYDLVLMDVHIPEMDGFEATATIRGKEKGRETHLPVVALTAAAMKGDRERCLAAGMDGYLTKPIRPEELDALLERYSAPRPAANQHTQNR